jgi:hypothetical protein
MTNLFYTASRPHHIGDILGGGNFGRGYDQYILDFSTIQGATNGWKLAGEMIIELVRKEKYPKMPSRLTCSYAYPSEKAARESLVGAGIPIYLYEVELVDASKPCHTVSRDLMSAVNRLCGNVPFVPHLRALADQYWRSQGGTFPEVIADSPLRVVRHVP